MKQPIRILLVEDEVLSAIVTEETLTKAGFQVKAVARTAAEAMLALREQTFEVALIDIHLDAQSDSDGIATAQALLHSQPIPFIYLTGVTINDDPVTFERAKNTKPAAFLNKPFRPEELVQQIELAVSNYGQSEQMNTLVSEDPVYLAVDHGFSRVSQMEIYYLEAARNFTTIHLTREAAERIIPNRNNQALVITGNLGYVTRYLSPRLFCRLDKSLVVNLKYIDRVEKDHILIGGRTVAIKEGVRKELLKHLSVIRTR